MIRNLELQPTFTAWLRLTGTPDSYRDRVNLPGAPSQDLRHR